MQVVSDSKDRVWEIQVDFDALRRVKADVKIDLGMPKYPGPSGLPLSVELYDSPAALLDVLWSICRPRAGGKGINKADFEAGFFGPQINEAKAAFFEEWQVFFRNLQQPHEAEAIKNLLLLMPNTIKTALEEQRRELGLTSTPSPKNMPASSESATTDA